MTMSVEVIYRESNHEVPPLEPLTRLLPKGSVNGQGSTPLPCDIIFERDAAVTMEDGVVIYTDIYRPATDAAVPAIVCWSPYGKHIHGLPLPWYISSDRLSNLQKFEGIDPAFFCAAGYGPQLPPVRQQLLGGKNRSG